MLTLVANAGRGRALWPLVRTILFHTIYLVFMDSNSLCLAQKAPVAGAGVLPLGSPQKVEKVERVEPVASVSTGYRLTSNDLIHIKVFQEEELETVARVGRDGTITFPMLGTISVGGRTLPETTGAIALALKEYLVRPQVAVRVVEYTKRKFTVLGQVNRPGTFDLPDESPLSLLEGIGLAGGYTRLANSSRITVKRSLPGMPEQVFKLDARQMARGKNAPRFLLQPGDTVMVEESLF
jgi:protein involved in polysaccharide export with SLBB domain